MDANAFVQNYINYNEMNESQATIQLDKKQQPNHHEKILKMG